MRIALCAFGTVGDIDPLLGLGLVLQRRGHEVMAVLNPEAVSRAERSGLPHCAAGEPWLPTTIADDPRLLDPKYVWREVFRPQITPMFETICRLHQQRPLSMVVNHIWCFGGAFAAETLGLPWTMVGLAPITWFSAALPSQLDHRRFPRWMRPWLIRNVAHPLIRRIYEPGLQQLANGLGLQQKRDRFWGVQREAALNLGLWSPSWRQPAQDDPPNAAIVGFPSPGEDAQLDPPTEAFLTAGDAPVVMGLGSALPKVAAPMYRMVVSACLALGRRALLVGCDAEQLGELGESPQVHTVSWAPYEPLFARAAAIVHHGGIGASASALRSGNPSVILAFGNDQHDNGFRSADNGAGVWLPKRRASRSRVTKALVHCLEDEVTRKRSRELAESILAEPAGEERAAELVLAKAAR